MSRVHTTADGRRCALARPCRSYLAPAARVRAASARIEDTQIAPPFPGLPIRGWKYGLAPPFIGLTERGWDNDGGNAPPRLACHHYRTSVLACAAQLGDREGSARAYTHGRSAACRADGAQRRSPAGRERPKARPTEKGGMGRACARAYKRRGRGSEVYYSVVEGGSDQR